MTGKGVSLFRIRVQFRLETIDAALDELKVRARPHGEIITYLPTGEGGDAERGWAGGTRTRTLERAHRASAS